VFLVVWVELVELGGLVRVGSEPTSAGAAPDYTGHRTSRAAGDVS
jgi:hypothetical protein